MIGNKPRVLSAAYSVIIAGAALVANSSAGGAADLRGGSIKDASPVYEPEYTELKYNWSGLYGGGYLGGAHGLWTIDFFRNNNHGHAEEGLDGFAGGGWIGYNMLLANNFVVGIEADLGGTNASQHNETFDNDKTDTEFGLFGSIRGRVGYAFNRLLVYGTAGFAFANVDENIQKGQNAGEQVVFEGKTVTGYTVGTGVEYAFSNNWIGRAEYLYANYGTEDLKNADGNRAVFENELHLVRAGLSYKF